MNPLTIIGSVAGVSVVAAISFGAVQAFYGFIGMIEAQTEARIEKVLMQQAEEYRQKSEATAKEEEEKDVAQRVIWDAELETEKEKTNELFNNAEQRIREDADAFDSDVFRSIAGVMCKAENSGYNSACRTCLIRAAEADFAAGEPRLAITTKRIEDWRIKCEETGKSIYCDYAIPAITSDGIRDLINWMNDADAAMLVYDSNHDIFVRQIQELQNVPIPTIKE